MSESAQVTTMLLSSTDEEPESDEAVIMDEEPESDEADKITGGPRLWFRSNSSPRFGYPFFFLFCGTERGKGGERE